MERPSNPVEFEYSSGIVSVIKNSFSKSTWNITHNSEALIGLTLRRNHFTLFVPPRRPNSKYIIQTEVVLPSPRSVLVLFYPKTSHIYIELSPNILLYCFIPFPFFFMKVNIWRCWLACSFPWITTLNSSGLIGSNPLYFTLRILNYKYKILLVSKFKFYWKLLLNWNMKKIHFMF